jgi:hypothetical protein
MSLVQTMGVDTDGRMRTVGGACLMGQKNPWIETELPTDARVRKQSGRSLFRLSETGTHANKNRDNNGRTETWYALGMYKVVVPDLRSQ